MIVGGMMMMNNDRAEPELVNAVIASDLTVKDLWLRYLALGGSRTRQDLQNYLSGDSAWVARDHDMLAHALNEHLRACGSRYSVPYSAHYSAPEDSSLN
jgi:hypothetical protein